MAEALTHLMPGNLLLSYSRQSDYLENFRELEGPRLEVDTFSTALEGIRKTVRLPQLRRQFARFLVENRVDAVYCPMWHPWNAAMVSVLQKKRVPYVLTVHDAVRHQGDSGRIQRRVEAHEQRHADAFVALSQHVKRQLDGRDYSPRFGTTVIPLPTFTYPPPTSHPNDAAHDTLHALRFLFLGRIRPYKGLDTLLDAFDQVLRVSGSAVSLTIAGSGDLGPYASRLSHLKEVDVLNKWLSDDEFGAVIHNHDVLVLPYLEASQSGVVAAAQGAGKPVVAFSVGGIREQIEHGVDGLLAVDQTPHGLAREVLRLVNDRNLLTRLREGVESRSAGESSWASSAASLVQLLKAILADW